MVIGRMAEAFEMAQQSIARLIVGREPNQDRRKGMWIHPPMAEVLEMPGLLPPGCTWRSSRAGWRTMSPPTLSWGYTWRQCGRRQWGGRRVEKGGTVGSVGAVVYV